MNKWYITLSLSFILTINPIYGGGDSAGGVIGGDTTGTTGGTKSNKISRSIASVNEVENSSSSDYEKTIKVALDKCLLKLGSSRSSNDFKDAQEIASEFNIKYNELLKSNSKNLDTLNFPECTYYVNQSPDRKLFKAFNFKASTETTDTKSTQTKSSIAK